MSESKETYGLIKKPYLHTRVRRSIIHGSQEVEAAMGEWMGKCGTSIQGNVIQP